MTHYLTASYLFHRQLKCMATELAAYLITGILIMSWYRNDWSHTHSHFTDRQKLVEILTHQST